jgi:hypothetical protein
MQASSVVTVRKRTQRPSEKQKKALVEFIKKNPQIIASKFSNSFTQKNAEAEWKKITQNSWIVFLMELSKNGPNGVRYFIKIFAYIM